MWMRCPSRRRWNEKVIKFNSLIPNILLAHISLVPNWAPMWIRNMGYTILLLAGCWCQTSKCEINWNLSLPLSCMCVLCVRVSTAVDYISPRNLHEHWLLSKGVPQIEFEIDLRAKLWMRKGLCSTDSFCWSNLHSKHFPYCPYCPEGGSRTALVTDVCLFIRLSASVRKKCGQKRLSRSKAIKQKIDFGISGNDESICVLRAFVFYYTSSINENSELIKQPTTDWWWFLLLFSIFIHILASLVASVATAQGSDRVWPKFYVLRK